LWISRLKRDTGGGFVSSAVTHLGRLAIELVDPQRFDGTCYRAANWIVVGTTTGRGRNDRHRRVVCAPKRVLVYPLVPAAARRLREH